MSRGADPCVRGAIKKEVKEKFSASGIGWFIDSQALSFRRSLV